MQKQPAEQKIEPLFTRLIKGVCEHEGMVSLNTLFSGETMTNYEVKCHASDIPRILGKGGVRFGSLKLLMAAAGQRAGRAMILFRIEIPEKGERTLFPPFRFNPDWPREATRQLLADVCGAIFKKPVDVTVTDMLGSAVMIVRADGEENEQLPHLILPPLQNVFQAIGAKVGCQLSIDLASK